MGRKVFLVLAAALLALGGLSASTQYVAATLHHPSQFGPPLVIRYVKRRGLLGKLIGAALSGDAIGEPATTALVTASIPVLIELARRALKAAEHEGAPSDPRTAEAPAPPA